MRVAPIALELGEYLTSAIGQGHDFDVRRLAQWLEANRIVRWLAIDLQTLRQREEWTDVVRGLELLDGVTGRRLRYLVNGPTDESQVDDRGGWWDLFVGCG